MQGILVFFGLSVAADSLSSALDLPVPGSIIGLIILVVWFVLRGGVAPEVSDAADVLVKGLALFLVPVGVAVITLVSSLDTDLITMIAVSVGALFVAILTTLVVAVLAQRFLDRSVTGPTGDAKRPDVVTSSIR